MIYSLLLPLLALGALGQRQCYYTDGSPSRYEPCVPNLPSGQNSSCCLLSGGDICLSSGLCLYTGPGARSTAFLIANGCTDPTGNDPACQQLCKGKSKESWSLYACPNDKWCCNTWTNVNFNCCDSSFDPIKIGTAIGVSAPQGSSSSDSSSPTHTPTGCSPTSTYIFGQSAPAPECPSTGPSVTAVGAGVGVSLGVCLLAALGTIFYLLRRQKQQVKATPTTSSGFSSAPTYDWPGSAISPSTVPHGASLAAPAHSQYGGSAYSARSYPAELSVQREAQELPTEQKLYYQP